MTPYRQCRGDGFPIFVERLLRKSVFQLRKRFGRTWAFRRRVENVCQPNGFGVVNQTVRTFRRKYLDDTIMRPVFRNILTTRAYIITFSAVSGHTVSDLSERTYAYACMNARTHANENSKYGIKPRAYDLNSRARSIS